MDDAPVAMSSAEHGPARRVIWPAVGAFALVLLALLALQAWRGRRQVHDFWRARLAETAAHEAQVVSAWVAGHAASGVVLASFPSVRRAIDPTLEPDGAGVSVDAAHLHRIARDVCGAFGTEGIWLLDANGAPVLREGAAESDVAAVAALARRAAAPPAPIAVEPLAAGERRLFALAVPVWRQGRDDDRVGAVILFVDPARRLWPSLTVAAGGAHSGTNLLVAHGATGPTLLSPRGRGAAGGAPPGARPLPAPGPAVKGGMVEMADGGATLLAVARPVPGVDWSVLATVDRGEAYARWREEVERLAVMALLVILAAVGVGQALARREQSRVLTAELASARALQEARQRSEQDVRRLNVELERRVRDRTVALEAANRELESFNYSVSHDLRAPLRHIEGFLRIVLEDHGSALPAEVRTHLDRVVAACRRMHALIEALLKLSRVGRQAMHVQPVDLAEVARIAFAELHATAGERRIELAIGPLPPVSGDPILLREMLDNLLANAIKFTRPRPVAHIEVGSQPGADGPVLYVRDDGVGFDPAHVDKLFGVFQRLHADAAFEGTGLGLSIVKRVLDKHGGRVWADGAPDRGATIFFTLPAGGTAPA